MSSRIKVFSRQIFICTLVLFWFANPVASQELSGRWSGSWQSQTNSHHGRMQATFHQLGPGVVDARFRGTFARVLPFRYRTRLNVVHQEPGLTVLSGSKKLGPLMGEFHYHAEISNGCFQAVYGSRRNRGSWTLQQISP